MSIDFTELETLVRDAARVAFTEVRAAHPDEQFYAFALYTDDGAMAIAPAANSEEALRLSAGGEAPSYSRWGTAEWAYEAVGAEHFRAAYALLNGPDRDEDEEDDDEESSAAFQSQLIQTLIGALHDLDRAGFFGSGDHRAQVTLFVSVSDSDDMLRIENESAQTLNPPDVYERFAARYSD